MGLFFSAPRKPTTSTPSSFSGSRGRISPRELREQVRHDLHDRLGKTKGEAVYGVLDAHLDQDRSFGHRGVNGREVDDMLDNMKDNRHDNLHEKDLDHIRDILGKHLND